MGSTALARRLPRAVFCRMPQSGVVQGPLGGHLQGRATACLGLRPPHRHLRPCPHCPHPPRHLRLHRHLRLRPLRLLQGCLLRSRSSRPPKRRRASAPAQSLPVVSAQRPSLVSPPSPSHRRRNQRRSGAAHQSGRRRARRRARRNGGSPMSDHIIITKDQLTGGGPCSPFYLDSPEWDEKKSGAVGEHVMQI